MTFTHRLITDLNSSKRNTTQLGTTIKTDSGIEVLTSFFSLFFEALERKCSTIELFISNLGGVYEPAMEKIQTLNQKTIEES